MRHFSVSLLRSLVLLVSDERRPRVWNRFYALALILLLAQGWAAASPVALSGAMAQYSVLGGAPGVQAPVSFTGNVGVFPGGTLTLNNTSIHGEVDYPAAIH